MEECDNWSSGESEPSELDPENLNIDNIDFDEPDVSSANQIFYNSCFSPSVKEFTGESKVCEDIPLTGNESVHYLLQ